MNIALRVTKRLLPSWLRVKLILGYSSLKSWWKYQDSTFPSHIRIEVCTQCNRSCWYCTNSVKAIPEKVMSLATFAAILSKLKEIRWTGPIGYHYLSEPLLHPDIETMVAMTKNALPGSMPIIFTNGDHLTLGKAMDLKWAGLAKCSITRHKPVTAEWEQRMKDVCAVDPSMFTVTDLHKSELINFAGVIKGLKNQPMNKRCMSPKRVLPIRINGDISLCCCDYEQTHTFGNVLEHPILDLWQQMHWVVLRDDLMGGVRTLDICQNCTGTK